jgi:hypothetical protein
MRAIRYMDDETVIQKGVELLMHSLGPLETIRFLNLSREKKVDSVKRHREWQKQLDQKQFFDEVF